MKILRADDRFHIVTRYRSDREWDATFPGTWDYERFAALADALEQSHVVGIGITTMREPGEVYEFLFTFRARRLYGKINLTPTGKDIIIYSTHRPYQGDTL